MIGLMGSSMAGHVPAFVRMTSRAAWRRWLEKHHAAKSEVWIAYYKKHTGKPCVSYEEAVEEALCFGWIDGQVRRLDDDSYAQRFTPRRSGSQWSTVNLRRFERLRAEGRVTAAGLAKGPTATTKIAAASWRLPDEVPADIEKALKKSPRAWANLRALTPSHRKRFILWLSSAKRPETRQRRMAQAIAKLENSEKLWGA